MRSSNSEENWNEKLLDIKIEKKKKQLTIHEGLEVCLVNLETAPQIRFHLDVFLPYRTNNKMLQEFIKKQI